MPSSTPKSQSSSPSPLIRPPKQARSRRTLEELMGAARELLLAHGPDALVVSDVARKAGTSVGAFYARFPGKEEMVRYLGERLVDEGAAEWPDPAADPSPEADRPASPDGNPDPAPLHDALTRLAHSCLEGTARALLLLDGHDDPAPRRLRRFEDRVAAHLAASAPGADPADATSTTRALEAAALVAGVRELALRSQTDDAPEALAGPEQIARLAAALAWPAPSSSGAGSSTPDAGSDPDSEGDTNKLPVDVFDVWG